MCCFEEDMMLLSLYFCSVSVFCVWARHETSGSYATNNISDYYLSYGDGTDPTYNSNTTSFNGRIVGGTVADITEYPYQLSLSYNGRHICGASLIDFKWVITAAHCTGGMAVNRLVIRAGSSFRNRGGQLITVKHVYIHPLYSPSLIDYDVAVLELHEQVTIWSAGLAVLPFETTVPPVGTYATVTGWGAVSESGALGSRLQAVTVPIISSNLCQRLYSEVRITSRMFCAGYLDQGGRDSCRGDSGGPLVVDRVLLGVVSWGYGCARPLQPGVYTFVPSLIKFIRSVIWRENYYY